MGFVKSGPHFSKVLHKLHFQETPFQDFMGFVKSGPHFSKVLHKLHFQETPFQDFMGFVKIERFSLDLAYRKIDPYFWTQSSQTIFTNFNLFGLISRL